MKKPLARMFRLLLVFIVGFAAGYLVRERRQDAEIRDAVGRAREEMRDAGLEAIERARRAGEGFATGAGAAAESTKAAFRELVHPDDQ